MVFVFSFWFISLKYNNFQDHPSCLKWKDFILFNGWTIFHWNIYRCVCIYIYIYIYIYHIFFIHSSTDGYLSCFHVLAIVNSAAVNIEVHICLQINNLIRELLKLVKADIGCQTETQFTVSFVFLLLLFLEIHSTDVQGRSL